MPLYIYLSLNGISKLNTKDTSTSDEFYLYISAYDICFDGLTIVLQYLLLRFNKGC